MTIDHRCDATILQQTNHNPLTLSRSLRLLLASLDDTADSRTAATPVLVDIGGCPDCLSVVLLSMTGIAAAAVLTEPQDKIRLVADLNDRLGQLLDELARAGDDGA